VDLTTGMDLESSIGRDRDINFFGVGGPIILFYLLFILTPNFFFFLEDLGSGHGHLWSPYRSVFGTHLSPIIYEQASYLQASQLLSDFIRNYF
jgi:hypothetical protein